MRGHSIHALATSYRRKPGGAHLSRQGVSWHDAIMGPGVARQWHRFFAANDLPRPDVIWASSDAPHCIVAERVGHAMKIPVVLDLYDNYDHFGLTRLPGMRMLYHAACRRAAAITVVSHTLADHVRRHIAPDTPIYVVPNGVPTRFFHPRPKQECREALGLPQAARLIGTAGAIHASRGIDDLFKAFLVLAEQDKNLHLVIAGPQDSTPERYEHPRIINLGMLPWQNVPQLINALDVMVVCNRDDTFGRFCHPLKLMEAIACGTPICAAAIGDSHLILKNTPNSLYSPGNFSQLAKNINKQLILPSQISSAATAIDWNQQATLLERTLQDHCRAEQ